MIPFLIASIPIEPPAPPVEYGPDYTDINRAAQQSTKENFPWWREKYGCEGTQWYPSDEECRDLTE